MKLRHLPVLTVLVAATLAACGSDDTTSSDATTATSAAAATEVALNEADVEFAQGMIAHHEQAIEMAEIALDPAVGASAEVVDLATRIQAAQDPEVALMTGWLDAAGESVTMDTSDGHDMSSMPGMMTADQMDEMAAMTGAEFDQMWLTMMIAHHEGAVSQSETVKADGSNADVLLLADQIIAAQQAEDRRPAGLRTSRRSTGAERQRHLRLGNAQVEFQCAEHDPGLVQPVVAVAVLDRVEPVEQHTPGDLLLDPRQVGAGTDPRAGREGHVTGEPVAVQIEIERARELVGVDVRRPEAQVQQRSRGHLDALEDLVSRRHSRRQSVSW